MAAVVALQRAADAVFHQPGGAVGALHAMAAVAAQRQRRVAAAVEEQHRLFAAGHRVADGGDQGGRQEVAALGRCRTHVDRGDGGEDGAAVACRQGDAAVAAGLDVGEGFQRGRGGDQHGRRGAEPGADHGHVAGVVNDAFLLLEGGFVLLVDDDEAEVGEGKEQRRAGADDDGGGAIGDGAPGGAAGAGGEVGVPDGGGDAEAAFEALQPLRGEGDLGEQHQRLTALAEGFGDGFEVGLGLAGAGDAVEQGDAEFARGDGVAEDGGGGVLVGGEDGAGMVGVGDREGRGRGQDGGFQQAGIRHTSDDAGAGARCLREVPGGAGFVAGQCIQHLLASFGDAGVGRGKDAAPARGRRGGGAGDDAERHRHHLAGW